MILGFTYFSRFFHASPRNVPFRRRKAPLNNREVEKAMVISRCHLYSSKKQSFCALDAARLHYDPFRGLEHSVSVRVFTVSKCGFHWPLSKREEGESILISRHRLSCLSRAPGQGLGSEYLLSVVSGRGRPNRNAAGECASKSVPLS